MATVKVRLRKRPNADGTHSIIIKILKNRVPSIITIGAVPRNDWNEAEKRVKKSHPNATRLNNLILKKLSEATDKALEMETQNGAVSAKAIQQKIKPKVGETFFAQAQAYLDDLKAAGKYNQYTADKPRIGHFREFLKDADITFADISKGLLEKFKIWLKSYHTLPPKKKRPADTQPPKRKRKSIAKPKKPLSKRTIENHIAVIRSVYSYARKNKVITKEQTPFGGDDGMKIRFPDSIKIGLTAEEVKRLEEVELTDEYQNHCRNIYLFSFYFAGMRAGDVMLVRWPQFQNGRYYYSMNKNDKADSLKVSDKVLRIITQYEKFRTDKDDLIFPELKRLENLEDRFIVERTTAFAVSAIDKCLRTYVAPAAKIEKKLTMHIARHTFGNLAGDKIPIQMLQKLYRHAHVSTTIGYQGNFIFKDTDDALSAVTDI